MYKPGAIITSKSISLFSQIKQTLRFALLFYFDNGSSLSSWFTQNNQQLRHIGDLHFHKPIYIKVLPSTQINESENREKINGGFFSNAQKVCSTWSPKRFQQHRFFTFITNILLNTSSLSPLYGRATNCDPLLQAFMCLRLILNINVTNNQVANKRHTLPHWDTEQVAVLRQEVTELSQRSSTPPPDHHIDHHMSCIDHQPGRG